MNKHPLLAIAALALVLATSVQAETKTFSDIGYYAEVGYSPVNLTGPGGSSKPHGARFLFGNDLNKNLGLEALYTANTTKDARTGYDASYSGLGVFLKPKMALSDNTQVFARAGLMRVDIRASAGGTHTGTDKAWGVGFQTHFTKSMYGQLDYMHSYDRDGYAAKGYTLSVGSRF